MPDAWHWEQLRIVLTIDLASARRCARDRKNVQRERWEGYAAACDMALNEMRRLEQRSPPAPIEDIVTE